MNASASRQPLIDAFKAVASQLIVLHHLAFYGPMSVYANELAPGLFAWMYDYGRIAVQVFLVIGGYLAAQSLTRDGILINQPLTRLIGHRYLKLAAPYLAALVLAILAAAIARALMAHEATPEAPSLMQVLAHTLLLQNLLGFDGLSAGVWYIAVDFQLYALLATVLWLARRAGSHAAAAASALIAVLVGASLFHFNRDPAWDNWALYFVGSYGLGALTFMATRRGNIPAWWPLVLALAVAALMADYRLRIAIALLVAMTLAVARHTGVIGRWPQSPIMAWLGQISYSVFLVHYPLCLIVNALFERFAAHTPGVQLFGIVIAWAASIAGGALFHRRIEAPAQAQLNARRA